MSLDMLVPAPYTDIRTDLYLQRSWKHPTPLEVKALHSLIPRCSGLYTISLINAAEQRAETVYIGQSSDLRERLGTLRREVYKAEKPDGSHHYAAPKLWVLRHLIPCSHFELSVFPFGAPVPRPFRLGFECLALYVSRLRDPFPALVNFGSHPECSFQRRARPHKMCGKVQEGSWHGLPWSDWAPVDASLPRDRAMYRVRLRGHTRLVYVGYGRLKDGMQRVLESSSQARDGYEISWVRDSSWTDYHYQSIRNDLIGVHVYQTGLVPSLQFAGD